MTNPNYVMIWLKPEIKALLDKQAKEKGMSRSAYIRELVLIANPPGSPEKQQEVELLNMIKKQQDAEKQRE